MKRYVLDGIAQHRLEQAITAYQQGETYLSAAAHNAGVSVYRMMVELESHDIALPANAQKFREGIKTLVNIFGSSDELRQVLNELDAPSN